jgi:hypothetical protein
MKPFDKNKKVPLIDEQMEKNLNDPSDLQINIQLNQQAFQIDSNAADKPDNTVVGAEEDEVQETFQRKPQFRLNENNKRRYP